MNAISKPSKLRAVKPKEARPTKPVCLVLGKPGVGKTWASLDFPSVYYIDTEGGADLAHYTDKLDAAGGVYFGVEQGSLDFEKVIDQVQALATEQHPYRTLVLDSVSKLFNQAIADESNRLGDKDAFGASKKQPINQMKRLMAWIARLDMNVVLIAHEKVEWGMVNGQRAEIGSTFDGWDKLEYDLHLVLRITREGSSRYATVRKSRLTGFPDQSRFPWSYADFAERYGRDVMEAPATPIALADTAVVAEIERLVNVMGLVEWKAKTLAAANVASFAELSAEKAGKELDRLNDRMKSKETV